MGAIVDFAARVERAEAKLEKCSITDKNKDLIRHFCEYKTAQKVKLPRIDKYLSTLRLVAERYLCDRDFTALTSDDIISWKGSHHRIPFHFKYGWFTPSYTTNAIERFTPSYTTNDTKLWKASQR